MEKELETSIMHHQRFGEGQRLADKASQALSERIIPTLHVSRFTGFLSGSRVLVFRDYCLISWPEIGETVPHTVGQWNGFP
jgi:hypothetical protein